MDRAARLPHVIVALVTRRPFIGSTIEKENPATEFDRVVTPSIVYHDNLAVDRNLGGVRKARGYANPIEHELQPHLGSLNNLWIHTLRAQNLVETRDVALDRLSNRRADENHWICFSGNQVDLGCGFVTLNGTPCHQRRDGIPRNEVAVAKK